MGQGDAGRGDERLLGGLCGHAGPGGLAYHALGRAAGRGRRPARLLADPPPLPALALHSAAAMVGARQRRSDVRETVNEGAEEEPLNLAALLLIINQAGQEQQDELPEEEEEQEDGEGNKDTISSAAERQAAARVRVRRAMVAAAMAERRAAADASLLARSEVIRWLRGASPAPVTERWGVWLRWAGALCLGCAVILGTVWLPVTFAFGLFSWAYPLLMLPSSLSPPSGSSGL